jgi:Skp family chaperone for outer membrane proteins
MTFKTLVAAGSAVAVTLAGASAAVAQAPAAPTQPAAPAVTHGNPPPGVCVITARALVANSTVGKYVQTRLQTLGQQAQAEVSGENTGIENEAKTLEGQRASLDQTTFNQRYALLQVRQDALQRKVAQRREELAATEQKAFGRVLQEAQPSIRQAYQAKGCSILFNSDAVAFGLGNPAMDITPQVITGLNAKITQFAFDRERLDAQPQAAAAGARPAAAAVTPAQPTRR